MNNIKLKFLDEIKSDDMFEMVQLLDKAQSHGLFIEIIYSALNNMKEFPDSSPLLCVQIAMEDWDL